MYNEPQSSSRMLASDWSWNTTWYLQDGLKNTVLVWEKKKCEHDSRVALIS